MAEKRFNLKKMIVLILMGLLYLFLLFRFILYMGGGMTIAPWVLILAVLPFLMVTYTSSIGTAREQQLDAMILELKTLTDNLSAGVMRCSVDDLFAVQYASEAALKLLGYSKNELFHQFEGNLASVIPGSDARRVSAGYTDARDKGSTECTFEFRIRHKNGRELWITEHVTIAQVNGGNCLFVLLMDVTDSRNARMEKRISDECYRIIYDTSEATIFDYDVEKEHIVNSGNFASKFGWNLPEGIYPKVIENFVHQDDYAFLDKIFTWAVTSDDSKAIGEIRLKNSADNYIWCTLELFAVMEEGHKAVRLIGKITNIDKVKREAIQLMETSMRDPLTGILNKAATKAGIEDEIAQYNGNGFHAFLIMDIDDFKRVNDRFGHMEGDRIIKAVAWTAMDTFRKTDIVGRIGGDEYVFFLKNLDSKEAVDALVQQFFEELKNVMIGDEYPVSVSVGIAFFPDDAKDHDGLYHCADLALYHSKHAGKNVFASYADSMENGSKSR